MRAISLWQPWASLWLSPSKLHETRHWYTPYRGWLAVHAAKRLVSNCGEDLDEIVIDRFGATWRTTLPRGAVIGKVFLWDCRPTEKVVETHNEDRLCGDFTEGRYAWRRGEFVVFRQPIQFKGAQSFFNVPERLLPADAV